MLRRLFFNLLSRFTPLHILMASPGAYSPSGADGNTQGAGLIDLNPRLYKSVDSGTWAVNDNVVVYGGQAFYNSTQTNADKLTLQSVWLDANGTYKIIYIGQKRADGGIIDVAIGDDTKSLDLYNNPTIENARVESSTFSPTSSGLKEVTLTINGKNGSSSGYTCYFTNLLIVRTA